jgi:hypothetical protein
MSNTETVFWINLTGNCFTKTVDVGFIWLKDYGTLFAFWEAGE